MRNREACDFPLMFTLNLGIFSDLTQPCSKPVHVKVHLDVASSLAFHLSGNRENGTLTRIQNLIRIFLRMAKSPLRDKKIGNLSLNFASEQINAFEQTVGGCFTPKK